MFAVVLFLSIVLTGLVWARRMTLNRGSKLEYDWDEYSSEFEDDESEEEEEDDGKNDSPDASSSLAVASVAAVDTIEAVSVEETDWVMGSDGYWWYHDKVTNEWWYKNTEGEIVQHN